MELLMLILISVYLYYLNFKLNFREFFSLFLYHQNLLIENLNVRPPYFRLIVVLVLSFSIFHAFFKTILSNNVKTDKVVLDTSNLIITKSDLLNSYRNVCWMYDEIDRWVCWNSIERPSNLNLVNIPRCIQYRLAIYSSMHRLNHFYKKSGARRIRSRLVSLRKSRQLSIWICLKPTCWSPNVRPYSSWCNCSTNSFHTRCEFDCGGGLISISEIKLKHFISLYRWISNTALHQISTYYYVRKRSKNRIKNEINQLLVGRSKLEL